MVDIIKVWWIPILIAAAVIVIAITDAVAKIRERIKKLWRK